MVNRKKILVAPLNWGLGHACRCIPIIQRLEEKGFEVVIASDGASLELLRKEFPQLKHFELPGYRITYTSKSRYFLWHLIKQAPQIYKTAKAERKAVRQISKNQNIDGVISDSRWGLQNLVVPAVYITHQWNVIAGRFTWLTSRLHQRLAYRFDHIWIIDRGGINSLAGRLSETGSRPEKNFLYIGRNQGLHNGRVTSNMIC